MKILCVDGQWITPYGEPPRWMAPTRHAQYRMVHLRRKDGAELPFTGAEVKEYRIETDHDPITGEWRETVATVRVSRWRIWDSGIVAAHTRSGSYCLPGYERALRECWETSEQWMRARRKPTGELA